MTSAKLNVTGPCWVINLEQYKFSIKYQNGKKNIVKDFSSKSSLHKLKNIAHMN